MSRRVPVHSERAGAGSLPGAPSRWRSRDLPLGVDMTRVHVLAVRPVLVALSRGSRFIQVSIIFLLLTGSASAQFTGNIQGTVDDPSGAAIPQAKIALLNLATQASAVTTTDATGGFRFLSLAPGPYKITVEAAGFATA